MGGGGAALEGSRAPMNLICVYLMPTLHASGVGLLGGYDLQKRVWEHSCRDKLCAKVDPQTSGHGLDLMVYPLVTPPLFSTVARVFSIYVFI